eukprot:scaffold8566_cov62-Alexandrium_tamarense.AAC.1
MESLELNDIKNGSEYVGETSNEKVEDSDEAFDDVEYEEEEYVVEEKDKRDKTTAVEVEEDEPELWQDDEVQMSLWDPVVNLRKKSRKTSSQSRAELLASQRKGKVVFIIPPKASAGKQTSEFTPSDESYRDK